MKKTIIANLKIPMDITVNYRDLLSSNIKLKFSIKKESKKKEPTYFIPKNTSGKS